MPAPIHSLLSVLVLVVPKLLLLLLMCPRQGMPWHYSCLHFQEYRNDIKPLVGLQIEMEGWNLPPVGGTPKLIECNKDISCQTYHCKDGNENDLFVINACSEEHEKCSTKLFDSFCKKVQMKRGYGGIAHSFCDHCYGQKCNADKVHLQSNHPVPSTKKPPPVVLEENSCIHAFRYDDHDPPPLVNGLTEKMREWGIEPRNDYQDAKKCLKKGVGCQTYRCQRENGDDIFVVNGCAAQKESPWCSHSELDKFCPKPLKPKCDYCHKKSGCNKNRIELKMHSLSATTHQQAVGEGTTAKGGRRGKTTTRPPVVVPRSNLQCLVEQICKIKDSDKPVKLSRRFTWREDEIDKECDELMLDLKANPRANLDNEIASIFKQPKDHGPMFTLDFIQLIDSD